MFGLTTQRVEQFYSVKIQIDQNRLLNNHVQHLLFRDVLFISQLLGYFSLVSKLGM